MVIHKFVLPIADEVGIGMPESAKILCVDDQGGNLYVWAIVNTSRPKVQRYFAVIGTGNPFPSVLLDSAGKPRGYVGTAIRSFDGSVWHVFDLGESR